MTSRAPMLSIIIPAFNEERRLPETLSTISEYLGVQPFHSEIIVVDDGSTDATLNVANRHPGTSVISRPHRGKGFAVRDGVLASQGEFVLICDADLSVPIEEWGALHQHLAGGSDIAIGSREGIGASRQGEPRYRHVMGRVFNLIIRGIAVKQIHDTQCGFKALRRQVAVELFHYMRVYGTDAKPLSGPAVTAYDVELLFLAQKYGHRIAEVPVVWRYGSESKVRILHDTARNFRDVFRVRLNDVRGMYASSGSIDVDRWVTAPPGPAYDPGGPPDGDNPRSPAGGPAVRTVAGDVGESL